MATITIEDLEHDREITDEEMKTVIGGAALGAEWRSPSKRQFPDSTFQPNQQRIPKRRSPNSKFNKRRFPDSLFNK